MKGRKRRGAGNADVIGRLNRERSSCGNGNEGGNTIIKEEKEQ